MSEDFDETTANEASGFSGFGGHLLAAHDDADAFQGVGGGASGMASLGIEDAEQLVALAAVSSVRDELQAALGVDDEGLEALVRRAGELLPPERFEVVSRSSPPEFGLGVLPPTPEMLAAAEMSAAEAVEGPPVGAPSSVNLISWMPAIRNQASRGTCVSFTLTALNEYILRRRGMQRDLSEQHLYYEIKLIDGSPGGCGTWQAKAVNALLNRGQCREQIWPYNPNPPCNNHGARPANARPDGLNYRLKTIAVPPRNVAAYKGHMAKQRPVTVSIPVYNSWYQSAETRRSGRITMRIGNEPAPYGHAVCLVGYQDSASSPGGGYFLVRNSWHTSWAYASPYGAGYGTIPYAYIANDAWEAFTAAVPGITGGDAAGEDEDQEDETAVQGKTKVVIEAGRNIRITISTE